AGEHVPDAQRLHGGGVHHEGADRGDHGRGRQPHRRARRRPPVGHRRDVRRPAHRPRPHARGELRGVSRGVVVAAGGPVPERGALNWRGATAGALGLLVCFGLAVVPLAASGYQLALAITLLSDIVLATSWALFSGPTRYISLATVAFFGIGAYTVGALGEALPWPLVLVIAAAIGVAVALVVGLSTLRLSGMYF